MRDLASIIKYWRRLSNPSEEWCRAVQDTSREFIKGIIIAGLRDREYWATPSSLNTH